MRDPERGIGGIYTYIYMYPRFPARAVAEEEVFRDSAANKEGERFLPWAI